MSHSGKSLNQAMAETSIAALIKRCEHAEEAARYLQKAADADTASTSFAGLHGRCQIRDRRFLILVASAAQASKLRQSAPRILKLLREGGFDLTEIRVQVQPGASDYPEAVGPDPAPSSRTAANSSSSHDDTSAAAALAFADKLALTLKPSPLQSAACKLATTLRRRLARGR